MPPDVWNLLVQIPIVVAFIYYTQYMNKQFMEFLDKQREADREIQKEMIGEINKLGNTVLRMEERTRPREKA